MTDIVADMIAQQFKSTIVISAAVLVLATGAHATEHISKLSPSRMLYVSFALPHQATHKKPAETRTSQSIKHANYQCVSSDIHPSRTPTPTAEPTTTPQPTSNPTPTTTITPSPTATPTSTPTPTPTSITTATPTPSEAPQLLLLTEVMPAPASPNPEWIELYNPTNTFVDLTGWHVDDVENGGSAPQTLTGIVPAHGYFLFELKSAIFNNGGDDVRLLDPTNTVISETSYTTSSSSESWGMDMATKLFCAQVPTPGSANTTSCTSPTPTTIPSPTTIPLTPCPQPTTIIPSPTSTPTSTPTPTPTTLSTPSRVFISEFLPRPPTGTGEWVELYNDSDSAASLDGWYIDDIAGGGSSPKQITVSIAAKSYAQVPLSSAILNNDADSVRLLNPQQQSVDELSYEDAEVDISFSRPDYTTHTVCKTVPTPGEENNSCVDAIASALTSDDTISPTPTPIDTTTQPATTTSSGETPTTARALPAVGDIQGISTYHPPANSIAEDVKSPPQQAKHTRSRIAFALASITSSGAALLLFFKKIKPW